MEKFGRKKARPRSNIPLPIGKILCFGRGSFEGLVAMLNNAFASLQDKKPKVLGEGTHLRPLTLPQRPTARGLQLVLWPRVMRASVAHGSEASPFP